jgi:5-methylcytosine-specific restriction endonuclease McrA
MNQKIIKRSEAKKLGLKSYFTGKLCVNNHLSDRQTLNGVCNECGRIRSRERMQKLWLENPEKVKETNRKNANKDPQKRNKKFKEWIAKNPEKYKENQIKYYQNNKEKIKERSKIWHYSNSEQASCNSKIWRTKNKEKVKINAKISKAKRKATIRGIIFEKITIEDIAKRDGLICYICGIETSIQAEPRSANKAEIEHIVSIAKGGNHTWENLKISCLRCNRMKGSRLTPEQTRDRLKKYKEGV